MAKLAVTEADLLDALVTASTAPEDAQTAQEMAETLGLPPRRVKQALQALHRQGRLRSYRVTRPAMDGRRSQVPAYTILPNPKAKRA